VIKTFCSFAAVIAMGLLFVDIATDAETGKMIFHLALFVLNALCATMED